MDWVTPRPANKSEILPIPTTPSPWPTTASRTVGRGGGRAKSRRRSVRVYAPGDPTKGRAMTRLTAWSPTSRRRAAKQMSYRRATGMTCSWAATWNTLSADGLGRVGQGAAAHITILLRIGQLTDTCAIENDDDGPRKRCHTLLSWPEPHDSLVHVIGCAASLWCSRADLFQARTAPVGTAPGGRNVHCITGMTLPVHFAQPVTSEVSVHLCHGNGRVPEHLLHGSEVRSAF